MLTRSCCLVTVGLLASVALRAQTPSYTSIEISSPAGSGGNIVAAALNRHGDVVGTWQVSSASSRAFVYYYRQRSASALNGAAASGINDSDKMAGEQINPATGPHAVAWYLNGGMEVLPDFMFSTATAVSNNGPVAGNINSAHLDNLAVEWNWKPTLHITELGVLWADPASPELASSTASAINGLGHIAGFSDAGVGTNPSTAQRFGIHAFLYRAGRMQDLGALALSHDGADDSEAYGINDQDQVVGLSTTAFPGRSASGAPCSNCGVADHAFLWSAGKMTDLGNLAGIAGWHSAASAINNLGEIVGYSDSKVGGKPAPRAFVYVGGRMLNLQFYVYQPDPNVRLTGAAGINCNGWIVANGYDIRAPNIKRAYLLVRRGPPRPQCLPP
jgi:probable HAF family extracellular repeat protein